MNAADNNLWLLPDGIEEMLPVDAMRLEILRRRLVDLCHGHGYDLVSPPLLEHLESLLRGGGEDLELETFKLIDHDTGRQLGIRADMTPQIARIDAHVLGASGPVRLCYAGPVLRARPKQAFENRELFQLGAELFGSERPDADVEIIELMMQCLDACGLGTGHLDVGHVGVYRALARDAGLRGDTESALFDALQRKSVPDIDAIVRELDVTAEMARTLVSLPELSGPLDDLEAQGARLAAVSPGAAAAVRDLAEVARAVRARCRDIIVFYDLAELRGYHYHTGVVFSAFLDGHGRELARGGRYDAVGAAGGRKRPATGFSLDLRQVIRLVPGDTPARGCILAPADSGDAALNAHIASLRAAGEGVVRDLGNGRDANTPACCDRRLRRRGDTWGIEPLDD